MLLRRNRQRRKEKQPEKRWRSCWVREIFTKRNQQEDYHHLVLEMRFVSQSTINQSVVCKKGKVHEQA